MGRLGRVFRQASDRMNLCLPTLAANRGPQRQVFVAGVEEQVRRKDGAPTWVQQQRSETWRVQIEQNQPVEPWPSLSQIRK
jgi:hypothetical protein